MTQLTANAPQWGREVERVHVDSVPYLAYRQRPRSVADFLATARQWNQREYLVQDDRRFTVAEHEAAVARVARYLEERGVGPGSKVVLLGFNSIEWVVGFWAVQALGAVAVLCNAWWSDDEAESAIRQVEPALVITHRATTWPSAGFDTLRTFVDDIGAEAELPQWPRDENALAIIMFSSGTTGAPKGVLMPHRSVIANIQNLLTLTGRLPNELTAEHQGTVSLLSVPLFHLAGVQVCLTNLLCGGKLVFLPGKFDPDQVLTLIETERVKAWGSIPTMVTRVLDHPDFTRYDTTSVTSVPMGGAAISAQLRERVAQSFTGVKSRVGSLYGLTEAGGVLAAGSGKDVAGKPGCVGRALPVVELKISNPDADGIGEVMARTPTVSDGYLGESTAITDAGGWLSTGDLGRLDADGLLFITGRSKDIIIRGGENISCVHVEDALATHPAVLEVAVVALPHEDLGEQVGAAFVLRPGMHAAPTELAAHAATRLGRYEIPTCWWNHTGPLPTNATGKILRKEVRDEWLKHGIRDRIG
ncbi:class I adenylate-forming enzyme family protein [Arthrobacter globiformis]|uniref:class I adenylate-forming enzyme family protein n=1 Tax=Arthrobacter globiformis TaxID=1665 RepID=UPI0027D7DEFB|nr:class I adenylate-forming enzyme family protein [Arthrobacter globiformis]